MPDPQVPPPLPPHPPSLPPSAPPPHVLPLGYSTGANMPRPKPRTPFTGRVAIGCFGYTLLTVGWFALGALVPNWGRVAWGGWVLMTGALLGFALYVRIRYGFSGVGYGILLSLGTFGTIAVLLCVGLILLLIAICGQKNGSNSPGSSTPYNPAPATSPATAPTTAPVTEPAGP